MDLQLLEGRRQESDRVHTLDAYLGKGNPILLTTDASPYGLVGFVTIGGKPVAWFACQVDDNDQEILDTESGNSSGQQVWELLALTLAVRA